MKSIAIVAFAASLVVSAAASAHGHGMRFHAFTPLPSGVGEGKMKFDSLAATSGAGPGKSIFTVRGDRDGDKFDRESHRFEGKWRERREAELRRERERKEHFWRKHEHRLSFSGGSRGKRNLQSGESQIDLNAI